MNAMAEIYAEWKTWTEADFGLLPADDACYFAKLMRQTPALRKLIAQRGKVLELGFGNGSFLRFARDRGLQVTGVDIVSDLVARARRQGYNAFDSVDSLLASRGADDAPFDAVFLFDVLEHLDADQIVALFHQLRACTGNQTVVVMRFPNGGGPLGLANQHGDPTHQTALTASKLDFFLHGTGWRLLSCRGDVFSVWNGRVGKLPHRAVAFVLRGLLEKLFRLIYFPQSRGVLSVNLLAVVGREP